MTKCLIHQELPLHLRAVCPLCFEQAGNIQAKQQHSANNLAADILEMLTKAMNNFKPRICTYLDYHQSDKKHYLFFFLRKDMHETRLKKSGEIILPSTLGHNVKWKHHQNHSLGTSLVVQWLRLHLPMQNLQAGSLVWELRSHMPLNQKIKTQDRSHIVTNSIKTLKMVYTHIHTYTHTQTLKKMIPCCFENLS